MTRSTLALIAVLLAGSASAQIVVDASDYPVGTNISNAIPGVTLSYITLSSPGERPSVGTSLPSVMYTATPLTIGSSEDGDPNSVLGGPTGGDTFQKLILLQFAQPVNYFSFVALSDSGDPVVADVFNSSGIDVANPLFPQGSSCAISSPGGFCQYLNVGGSYQSSTPISTLMIGSISAEADVLKIKAPEIDSSSAVSSLTLLLGSLMVLISRRPKSAKNRAANR